MRYLEDCIAKLKAQNAPTASSAPDVSQPYPAPSPYTAPGSYSESSASDVEMMNSEHPSPTYNATTPHQPSISPALLAQDYHERHNSLTSYTSYNYGTTSSNVSPAFGPRAYDYAVSNSSELTSPALPPQREERDLDQEATAALLMLNTERRGTSAAVGPGGRTMSVRDLLST